MSCTVSNTFDFYLRKLSKIPKEKNGEIYTGYYIHALTELTQNGHSLTKVVFIRVMNVKKCLEIGQPR